MKYLLLSFTLTLLINLKAQKNANHIEITPSYYSPVKEKMAENVFQTFLKFDQVDYDFNQNFKPYYINNVEFKKGYNVSLKNVHYESVPVSPEEAMVLNEKQYDLTSQVIPTVELMESRTSCRAFYRFCPYLKIDGVYNKITKISFDLIDLGLVNTLKSANTTAVSSVLNDGEWFRISVSKTGIYKMDKAFLTSLGININSVDPRNIKLYGNGGGMISKENSDFHHDDLVENAIEIIGENDGVFNDNDFIRFYGQGPNIWKFNNGEFSHEKNLYSDSTFYFLTINSSPSKRINSLPESTLPSTHQTTSFDDHQFYELDETNLIKTGSQWYGNSFEYNTSQEFEFNIPDIISSEDVNVEIDLVARSTSGDNSYNLYFNNSFVENIPVTNVSGVYYADYVKSSNTSHLLSNSSSNLKIRLDYSKPNSGALGWLNYIEVKSRRELNFTSTNLFFRDSRMVGAGNVGEFSVSGMSSNFLIWDVTDPTDAGNQEYTLNGDVAKFSQLTDDLREYVCFSSNYLTPGYSGTVSNQNLHALEQPDMIIISHPDFHNEAERLAQFHRDQDEMAVVVVSPQQVYNEFSSGAQDVMGIRLFMKMFYDRAVGEDDYPDHLLLFGDGSYDPKNRISDNTNFVLCYQSPASIKPTTSYVADDFYVLLDDSEGEWNNGVETIDMGVGRFPVKTIQEAKDMVDKTIRYASGNDIIAVDNCGDLSTTVSTFGDWRNNIVFIADDEDSNTHLNQSDFLATYVDTTYENLNIQKIYFDAYVQESTPGGDRYPDVNRAIDEVMDKGALIINYTGHGGELGLAHERVVEISDVQDWENKYRLPLIMTATCEFSRFDDPALTSAGELVVLNPIGGAVAMFTTVRLVYSSPNFVLNQNFYHSLLDTSSVESPRLGDIYKRMKRESGGSANHRNFTLLGDPALRLSYPKYEVVTNSINGVPANSLTDTIHSLELMTVVGQVNDTGGQIKSDFNGVVYPTVYDKNSIVTTLANDGGSSKEFSSQKNIVYKGKATITNGLFEFSFVVPKDIAYNFGKGKISYYVVSENEDGAGFFDDFTIGGSLDSAEVDEDGPEITLLINDENFVFGGITDESPQLIAKLSDSTGINTVGNGIGHDIVAIIDEESTTPYVLNEYYEANIDDYQRGEIRYSFSDLEDGRHQLKLKVWDVYNNSSESYTEFVVASSADLALSHVLNYPNPFTTQTSFFFEHNQACVSMNVQVQIFTVSGKLVKTLNDTMEGHSFRNDGISWDGLDDYGDRLGRGVYVYRVKVSTENGSVDEKIEKLVILR